MISSMDTTQTEEDEAKRVALIKKRTISSVEDDQSIRTRQEKKEASSFWKGIEGFYTLVITNKEFKESTMKLGYPGEETMEPALVNVYELRHTKNLDRHYGEVPNQIVLLILGRLVKPVAELQTSIEKWAYVFRDHGMRSGTAKLSTTKYIEDFNLVIENDPAIREFIERIDVNNLPNSVRERYLSDLEKYNSYMNYLEDTVEARGEAKGKVEAIATFKMLGIDEEIIAKASKILGTGGTGS